MRRAASFVDWIQNITSTPQVKTDGCDAWPSNANAANARSRRAGMNVAPLQRSRFRLTKETSVMLWTIIVILLVLWLLGLIGHIGGSLIHLLLVIAVVVLIINLVTGRRAV